MRLALVRLIFSAGLIFYTGSHGVAAQSERAVLENVLNGYIVPAYQDFEKNTRQLSERANRLCARPGHKHLDQLREAFGGTVIAWSSVEWFQVGPIVDNNRIERILFFPDRKSRALRQVQSALQGKNEAVLDLAGLQLMSVAVQGLGALDFLLFGKNSGLLAEGDDFRCGFIKSIGKNLHHIARASLDAWQENEGLRHAWTRPQEDNPLYRTQQEALNLLISTLVHALEAIRDTRIGVFLREDADRDRPKSAALWRSSSTMPSIAANLEGLETLFTQSRIESILPENASQTGDTIRFEFRQAIKTARQLNAPVANLLLVPGQREKIRFLALSIGFLIDRLETELSPALGIHVGFSFGDGD